MYGIIKQIRICRDIDDVFKEFQDWVLSKKQEWKHNGIVIDKEGLSEFGHQYWLKLHSENGLGNIVLYESNGYYWVDFEGGNYDYDVMYLKAGIQFNDITELDTYEKELIQHIIWSGNDV